MQILAICITAIFANNVILSRFMGICPFLGVSGKMSSTKGMSLAVMAVIIMSNIIIYPVRILLVRLNIQYLETITFIMIIASNVQLTEMVIRKYNNRLHNTLGVYLPLITTNCAVLGTALRCSMNDYNFAESIVYSVGVSVGFALAIFIMAGIRERLENNTDIPEPFRGMPIVLITAGLMSIAFMGFSGMGG